jgi:hypothetical protein
MYVVAPPAPPEPWRYERDDDNDSKYVLCAGDMNVVNGDGDTDMENMRRAYGRHFFWFRHDGRAYVVRDAATIRELVDLYRPQSDLGREQGALGRKQGDLGRRQGELGREQARLGIEEARIAIRFDEDNRDAQSRRRELARRQRDLARRQADLGREQSRFGREQSRLGERQSELSRNIERKLRPMLDEMIRNGFAERVK